MKKKKIFLIIFFILISVSIIAFIIIVFKETSLENVSKGWIEGERKASIEARNISYENYFGTDITANGLKYLLSEIKMDNKLASMNGELSIVGLCYISNNQYKFFKLSDPSINPEDKGLYRKTIDGNKIEKDTFDDYNFSPDVETIIDNIDYEATYSINVANKKIYNVDKTNNTGFEKDENPMGSSQKGNTGGYYSNKYMRLIYIIENPKQ